MSSPSRDGAIRYLIFPTVMVASMVAGFLVVSSGLPEQAAIGLVLPAGLIVFAGERLAPFRDDWSRSHGDWGADFGHNTVSAALGHGLIAVIGLTLFVAVSDLITEAVGRGLWIDTAPLVVQFVAALVIWEFGQYWAHRISHENGDTRPWRWHAVHHSPTRLYFFNAARDHPIGALWLYGTAAAPLYLLGTPVEVFTLITLFSAVHGLFQHANIDLRLGPLNWVFSNAELHRMHHAVDISTANHNYGANLIIWDIVFGTRRLDPEPFTDPIGIGYLPTFPKSYWPQLTVPLASYWERLLREGQRSEVNA